MKTNRSSHDQSASSPEIIEKELSYIIVAAFFVVYNTLGFGFLEAIYARALEIVLKSRGLLVEREYPLVVEFQGQRIGFHRVDMLVERRIIVEIKSTELLPPISKRQLRSYLAASKLQLGLILHFGPRAEYHRVLGSNRPGA